MTDVRARFEDYLRRLGDVAASRDDVVGLAGFGSTADRTRVDEWSDHDFAWITASGAEDRYRFDLSWLPDASSIALSVVEHHGGVKVIYDDGHVLEFGITDLPSFRDWAGNRIEVVVDKGGVAEAVAEILAKPLPAGRDDVRDIRLFCTQILIGMGRARRGEVLSGSRLIREDAVGRLLAVLGSRLPGDRDRLDTLDPFRRFDFVHPEVAARVESAIRMPLDDGARALADLAEELLADGWEDFPRAGITALRRKLGWGRAPSPAAR